ncbi:MAG: fibronectin type III domain-containing protein, partial [Gaiellales bacterium]
AAGNVSSARTVRVLVKHVRPTRPARLRAKAKTARTVTLTWAPSRAASGIAGYKVQQRVGKRWKPLKATIRPNRRIVRVTQLRQGTTYSFRIVARGKAGKTSFASRPLRAKTR